MSKPRVLLLAVLPLLSFGWLFSSAHWKKDQAISIVTEPSSLKNLNKKTLSKAAEARGFVEKNNYNDAVCFLVDMSLPSGQKRFLVYDLKKDSVQMSGLVTHGSCNQDWLQGRKYGNTVGCGCTSLGKYRVGNSYNGRFGLAFKLYGLEKTNNQAFARFVVLHSHSCVPATETNDDICQSEGCPTVAPAFLQQIKVIINASNKPVLLWIYE